MDFENNPLTAGDQEAGENNENQTNNNANPKTFSQEDVNRIVSERLNKERDRMAADIKARELKVQLREEISKRGMNPRIAEILSIQDEKDITAKLDALQNIYPAKNDENTDNKGFIQVGSMLEPARPVSVDPIRRAMGLQQ